MTALFNLTDTVDRGGERWPSREALIFGDRRLSHGELSRRVNALSASLSDLGVKRGQVVALLLQNCIEFIEATYAINKIGGIFLPLNYRLAPAEWQYILDHSASTMLITQQEFLPGVRSIRASLPGLRNVALIDAEHSQAQILAFESLIDESLGRSVDTIDVGLEDVQRLMYTSGTTSRPKGVPLTYGNVLWKTFAHITEFSLTSADRTLVVGPLYHVGAFDAPGTTTLYVGGSLVILRKFDPDETMRAIQTEKPTNVWLAPAMLIALLQLSDLSSYDSSSIRFIVNGGEKLPISVIKKVLETFPGVWLADGYGLTETASGDTFLDRDNTISKLGSVGRPVSHVDLKIVGANNASVEPGVLGEILLRGPKVFGGYWRDAEATTRAFVDGWFRTGDIGYLDEDGYLFISDRKKDMIISGGENVATPEVERVFYEHPLVREAAVIGRADPRWGEVPQAIVVLHPGAELTSQELMEFCATKLAKFKVPKRIEFVDSLPRTPSGKVLKRELRDHYR